MARLSKFYSIRGFLPFCQRTQVYAGKHLVYWRIFIFVWQFLCQVDKGIHLVVAILFSQDIDLTLCLVSNPLIPRLRIPAPEFR